MSAFEDAMPCGNCCVCGEELDHAEAGFCEHCQEGFHWSRCGGWKGGKHTCETCKSQSDE